MSAHTCEEMYWRSGKCSCFTCSECLDEGDVALETDDIKDNGGAYRPCAQCAAWAS